MLLMFRFLHLADIHLDTKFLGKSADLRKVLKEAQFEGFRRAIDCALEEQVHCLLIAGDLFDNELFSFATERFLLEQLQRLRDAQIPCVYVTGNHDPGGREHRSRSIQWPENFHLVWQSTPQAVEISRDGTLLGTVVAAGHSRKNESANLAAKFPRPEGSVPSVALLHALVTSASSADCHDRYAPCSPEDLCNSGYHYWALGHVHLRQQVDLASSAWYSGNLQGRNPTETGAKGGLLVTIDGNGLPHVQFKPLAPAYWETLTLGNLANAQSLTDLRASAELEMDQIRTGQQAQPDDWLLRIALTGPCPLAGILEDSDECEELEEDLALALGARYVEITTRGVVPAVSVDAFRDENHVLGEVLRLIEECDEELLSLLSPKPLAGIQTKDLDEISYLRRLVKDLEFEAVSYFRGKTDAD